MDAFAAATFERLMDRTPERDPDPIPEQVDAFDAGPQPIDGRAYRNAMGRFATGVTVVTCTSAHGPVGMTVNSFTSLSLDPPLVMWSPAKSSRRYEAFAAAPRFAIHVLGEEQASVADAFMRAADAFGGTRNSLAEDGLPLIEDCLARFECIRIAAHEAGDHMIEIGRVVAMTARDGAPLLYFRGGYGAMG
ncbi:MAG: flavin reductase family protein [Pseudomonadota bacterium]